MSRKNEKSDINASKCNHEMNERRKNIGSNLSFAGAESYKLLRTNLILSMSADIPCKVIGITSSLRGEGKSTTAINLAISLAEADKRVILIEADMRIPYIARTLCFDEKPGLSNFLTGQVQINDAVRSGIMNQNLYVIPAGDVPPNPAELLSSALMSKAIDALSASFDYIIMDLPPILSVSDSLAISRLLNGMIVVVRENFCDRRALSDTMRQLEYLNVKVLGFVLNASQSRSKAYGKYSKYICNKYGSKYGYDYYQKQPEAKKKASQRGTAACPTEKGNHTQPKAQAPDANTEAASAHASNTQQKKE